MVLAPLGLLAAGKAWGEWSVHDFADPSARHQIAAASRNVSPPAVAPSGLERLSDIWTAPFPDYSPPFMRSSAFGYILSAIFGVGTIILLAVLADWIARKVRPELNHAPASTEES